MDQYKIELRINNSNIIVYYIKADSKISAKAQVVNRFNSGNNSIEIVNIDKI